MVYNINNGRYSPSQVEETFGQQVDIVNISEFNEGKGPDYAYWDSITHPETGETLRATRGYLGKQDNECYYAEYQNGQGKYYNYTRGMSGKSISEQQLDDKKLRDKSVSEVEPPKEEFRQQDVGDSKIGRFREEMSSKRTSIEGETHTDAHELGRRDFTSSMRTAQSQTSSQSNESAKRNFANHMNGSGGSAAPQTSSQAHSEGSKNGIHR